MSKEEFTLHLSEIVQFMWRLANRDLFTIGGIDISFMNLFAFVFTAWAGRNFFKVLLDRKNGEV